MEINRQAPNAGAGKFASMNKTNERRMCTIK